MAKNSNKSRSNSNSNKGPATDAIDSVSEDLNTNPAQNGVSSTDQVQAPSAPEVNPEDLKVDQPAPPPIDSPDDTSDDSGVEPAPTQADEEDDEEEDETPARPTRRGSTQTSDEEGMGFPRKNGKTVSVVSGKPHETVRNVAGVMVPLTLEEAVGNSTKGVEPVSDVELIGKLKKLGKL